MKGRPGTIRTKLGQRRPDKNPVFGIKPFLLLPGVLVRSNGPDSKKNKLHKSRYNYSNYSTVIRTKIRWGKKNEK
jgi:hypothetical protein